MSAATGSETREVDLAEQRRRTLHEQAPLLAAELGDGWQVRPSHHGHSDRFELHGPNGEHIMITAGTRRVEARGLHPTVGRYFPKDFGVTPRTITFDASKTTPQMAADIRRRLLPSVREVHRVVAAKQAAREHRLLLRRTFLEASADVLPGLEWKQTANCQGESEYTYARLADSGVHMIIDMPEYSADDVKLTLSGLRRDDAFKIAEAVAATRQTRKP